MRVMLDTNVLISGMVFPRTRAQVVGSDSKKPYSRVNDYLLAEAADVLARKFQSREGLLDAMLHSFRVEKLPLPPITEIREVRSYLRYPKDAPVLASALQARPEVFVSGDRDLHTPEVLALIRVCSTEEALVLLE